MAKVIIGRKLGMTQFFTEDGRQVAVTVIQAGPCPVVAGQDRGRPRLRRRPARLRARCPSASSPSPSAGTSAKDDIAPHRHLHEFRGAFELAAGEIVTVEGFEPGRRDQGQRALEGQGLRRHDQAPRLLPRPGQSHGSHNVRAPGSIGQSATPSRVIKGVRMSGHMGAEQHHAARPAGARPRRRAQPAARHRRGPGPDRRPRVRAGGSLMAALTAPVVGGKGNVELAAEVFGHETHRPAAATRPCGPRCSRAARARPQTKTRGQVAGGARQAVAPEGHRPRPRRARPARRSGRAAAWSSGRTRATTASR